MRHLLIASTSTRLLSQGFVSRPSRGEDQLYVQRKQMGARPPDLHLKHQHDTFLTGAR